MIYISNHTENISMEQKAEGFTNRTRKSMNNIMYKRMWKINRNHKSKHRSLFRWS